MEQYVIKGGNPLYGEVEIGGAKNAALAILAAAIMTDETVTIDNLPNVRDINVLLQAIEEIGAHVERVDIHKVKINGSFIRGVNVDNEFIRRIRASYYLIGALLGKYKHAEVALPGGCDIGSRPIDLHMKGFRSMGADIDIAHGLVIARAKELKGTHIYMDKVSVGATINIMMAAAMADGKTVIENAAKEPHVVDVANFLNSMGANIRGAGTDVIRIVGVEKAQSNIPDNGEIEKLVENYRKALIMHTYQQALIHQRLSNEISEGELADYYEKNKELFRLERPLMQGLFIKVPLTAATFL